MPLPPMPLKKTGESIIRAALLAAAWNDQRDAKWPYPHSTHCRL
jgi:hypothetical protein